MIRVLFILFSACWVLLLYLRKARKRGLGEIFHAPKLVPAVVIVLGAVLLSAFLYNYAPLAGDAAYYFGRSNRILHHGDFTYCEGHEFSLALVSSARLLTERTLHLPPSASITTITFALALLYCVAIYKFVSAGTKNRSLSILAVVLAPFSVFTFQMLFGGVYAQFLSASLFLLGASFYFQKRTHPWKPALLFALAALAHVWSGVAFLFAFGIFLLLARMLRYKEFTMLAKRTLKTLAISVLVLFGVGLSLNYWITFVEFTPFQINPVFVWGIAESVVAALLAIFGLVAIASRRNPFCLFMFSWAILCSAILFLHSSPLAPRVVFLLPIPVFAAFGIHRLWEMTRGRWKGLVVGGLICAAVVSGIYQNAKYIEDNHSHLSRSLNLRDIDQIQKITETYGYGSQNILIVIESHNYDLLGWAESLTNAPIWYNEEPIPDVLKENRKIVRLGVS